MMNLMSKEQLRIRILQDLDTHITREIILKAVRLSTGIADGALTYSLLQMARNGNLHPLIEILVEAKLLKKRGSQYDYTTLASI
jgi:hypothetical protein